MSPIWDTSSLLASEKQQFTLICIWHKWEGMMGFYLLVYVCLDILVCWSYTWWSTLWRPRNWAGGQRDDVSLAPVLGFLTWTTYLPAFAWLALLCYSCANTLWMSLQFVSATRSTVSPWKSSTLGLPIVHALHTSSPDCTSSALVPVPGVTNAWVARNPSCVLPFSLQLFH
jgi:hypothetical protein